MSLIDHVRHTIERQRTFSPGHRVGIAVSGGADSVFLLHALHELAPIWNLHLSVVHLDHGIRGDASREDAAFVRDLAAQFALPCHFREVAVPEIDDNLEQAARRVRHDFFRDLIASHAIDRVATGHTLSDQSETVLYRLLRGSGLTGLCGILPLTADCLARPLLYIRRTEIEDWLTGRHIAWREDETNQNPTYARNRLRHQVLPLLKDAFNPRLDDALAHLATLAQDEEDFWNREILPKYPVTAGPVSKFRTSELTGVHPALARRLIRRALERVKGDLRQIDFGHVETILEMARATEGSGRVQLPGLDIFRSFDWLRIAPTGFDRALERDFEMPVNIPLSITLPDGHALLTLTLIHREENQETYDKLGDELDWQRLTFLSEPDAAGQGGASSGLLELRNWRPGDHYRRVGQSQEQKIKLLFQEARIPLWDRRHWPVLTSKGRIVWTRQFGPAAEFAADSDTRTMLRVVEQHYPEE
jgi:tRNA(Ile)-lysidine synthase